MPLQSHVILGVHITDRVSHVDAVQHLFTRYGCSIKTRIGLHETQSDFCSPNGLILLEMLDDGTAGDELTEQLESLDGVEVKKMVFDHP